jgi:hypothetical protein
MRKRLAILLELTVLIFLLAGCAGLSKEAEVKCPKCGTVFKIHEGPYYGGRN